MVAEPVAELETNSAVGTPESEGTQEAVQPDAPPPSTGSETPETGSVEGEATPRSPESYPLEELNKLYRERPSELTPALAERRDALIQSENDRRAREQETLVRYQQAEEQRTRDLLALRDTTLTRLQQERERIMSRALDYETQTELISEREQAILNEYQSSAADIATASMSYEVGNTLLSLYGDSVQNRRAIAAMSVEDRVSKLIEASYMKGRIDGPGVEAKVTKSTEWHKDGYHSSSYKRGQDDLKAAHPEIFGNASRTEGGRATSGSWTYERYMSATPAERREISPAEEGRIIREEQQRRTGR